jgi:hypothetical protein
MYEFYLQAICCSFYLFCFIVVISSVNLLKARKKEDPSRNRMIQLPVKARKLERRLYHSASSLEEYNDRTTLKKRLLALARVIAVQHCESRNFENTVARINEPNRLFQTTGSSWMDNNHRGSVTSQSSIDSSSLFSNNINRSSFLSTNSIDSLSGLRESVDAKAVIDSTRSGVSSKRPSATDTMEGNSSVGPEKKRRESSNLFEMPAPRQRAISSSTTNNSAANSGGPNNTVHPLAKTHASTSLTSSTDVPHLSRSSAITTTTERQKSINEKLQQQILDNIRLQEEIVRKLQQTNQQISYDNNIINVNTQQQHLKVYDTAPLSMYSNVTTTGQHNVGIQPNTGMSSSTGINTSGSSSLQLPHTSSLMNVGVVNQLLLQEQQFSDYNANSRGTFLQQQQTYLSNNSNTLFRVGDSMRNQLLYQQQQQQQLQQAAALSYGDGNMSLQPHQYNSLLQQQQQQQLTRPIPNLQTSMSDINAIGGNNHNMGIGQAQTKLSSSQLQQLLPSFQNQNSLLAMTPQQQMSMQMQLVNNVVPSSITSNVPASQTHQMNSLSERSVISNRSVPSLPGQQLSLDQQSTNTSNDNSEQPLDATFDWWK